MRYRRAADLGIAYDPTNLMTEDFIMMTRNDYRRNHYNGESGVVLDLRTDGGERRQVILFEEESSNHNEQRYRIDQIEPLRTQVEAAYSLTIHKSQGSEFGTVLLLLPPEATEALSRELLYTGVTRCRQGCVIVATEESFEFAIKNRLLRNNGLRDRVGELTSGSSRILPF